MIDESERQRLLDAYLDRILEINQTTNLTRITSGEEARLLHIEDSLLGLPEMNDSPDGLYGDLGSGGGFPGVPLALYTGRPTVLVDSVKKKMALVGGVLDNLGLSGQITTYDGRIEDLALERKGQFSVLTARALSRLVSLLELSAPLLKQGGRLICYKADIQEDEIAEARAVEGMLGMKLVSSRETLLSDNATKRTLLVYEKMGRPRIKLPRRVGMAQKNPLKPRS